MCLGRVKAVEAVDLRREGGGNRLAGVRREAAGCHLRSGGCHKTFPPPAPRRLAGGGLEMLVAAEAPRGKGKGGGMDERHVSSAPAVLRSQRWFCRCRPGATRGSGGDKRGV